MRSIPQHFTTQPVEVREDLVLELAELSHGSGGSKSKGFEEADVLSSLATWAPWKNDAKTQDFWKVVEKIACPHIIGFVDLYVIVRFI